MASSSHEPDRVASFVERHDFAAERLGRVLAVSLDDRVAARRALAVGLSRMPARTSASGGDALVDVYRAAWKSATRAPSRSRRFNGSETVIVAADSLPDRIRAALADLPPRQRAALTCRAALGWSDRVSAIAHGTEPSTIALRRRRGIGALRDQLPRDLRDPEAHVDALINELVGSIGQLVPAARASRARRLRRTVTRRVAVAAIGLAAIAAIGAAVGDDEASVLSESVVDVEVDAPRGSQAPFAPIGDGRGGFVAFEQRGWQLISSDDGSNWRRGSRLNVSSIDLRLSIERIFRSDNRFVALVGSSSGGTSSLTGSDAPRIAVASELDDWTLTSFDPGPLADIRGLRPSIELLNVALAGDRVLVAADIAYDLDLVALGFASREVCALTNDASGITAHRCDSSSSLIASNTQRDELRLDGKPRLFESVNGRAFTEVDADVEVNPFEFASLGSGFAMLDDSSRTLSISDDGTSWSVAFETGIDNRLGLLETRGDEALTITPSRDGWAAHHLVDGQITSRPLPIDLDPATIWIKPQLVQGPAGWAVFVTRSRPWERHTETDLGWALEHEGWIVERKVDDGTITARSTIDGTYVEFAHAYSPDGPRFDHPYVRHGLFGGVELLRPGTAEVMVTVTGDRIRRSWITGDVERASEMAEIEWNGHRVEGNLRTGPITVSAPDGTTRTWTDGFAFTDGDLGDGAELTPATSESSGSIEVSLTDGAEVLSIPLDALGPLDIKGRDPTDDAVRATVLFSPNGVDWTVLWETSRETWYGSVAVGDDEVLLSAAGVAAEPERLPVSPP